MCEYLSVTFPQFPVDLRRTGQQKTKRRFEYIFVTSVDSYMRIFWVLTVLGVSTFAILYHLWTLLYLLISLESSRYALCWDWGWGWRQDWTTDDVTREFVNHSAWNVVSVPHFETKTRWIEKPAPFFLNDGVGMWSTPGLLPRVMWSTTSKSTYIKLSKCANEQKCSCSSPHARSSYCSFLRSFFFVDPGPPNKTNNWFTLDEYRSCVDFTQKWLHGRMFVLYVDTYLHGCGCRDDDAPRRWFTAFLPLHSEIRSYLESA